jgi:hypothetical protein
MKHWKHTSLVSTACYFDATKTVLKYVPRGEQALERSILQGGAVHEKTGSADIEGSNDGYCARCSRHRSPECLLGESTRWKDNQGGRDHLDSHAVQDWAAIY